MKTLVLMRHAKSSWERPAMSDHERPLNPRGLRAAPRIGAYLRDLPLHPDQVLCSTAERARKTWELAGAAFAQPIEVEYRDDLYGVMPTELIRIIHSVEESVATLLVLGHNPTIQALALDLCNGEGSSEEAQNLMAVKFSTASFAQLQFAGNRWDEVESGKGQLIRFVKPKMLP